MGVFKKQGAYWIDYRFNGRRKREKVGPSKTLADKALRKRQIEIAENKFLDVKRAARVSFKTLATTYLETHSKPNKKSWKSSDSNSLRNLTPFFGHRYLHEISPMLIEKYKNERRSAVSNASVNRELSCLRAMFNRAIDWEMATDNPVRKVKFLKEDSGRLRYLEKEEIKQLLDVCNPMLKAIVTVAINTGMRKGELQKLKWRNVDIERNLICLEETKNGERRYCPMNVTLKKVFMSIPKHEESPYIFCNNKGQSYNFRQAFETALKKAGIIGFRFHDLRHTFASHLVMSGVDLNTVRELLGHKSLVMTLRYSHLSADHKTRAVSLLESRMDTYRTPSQSDFEKGDLHSSLTPLELPA
jgi:integrase